MQKMHISFIKDLKNAEFYELFVYLDLILDAKESKDNQLKQVVGRIKNHRNKLGLLRDTKPRHHLTGIINTKVRNRTEYLACLRMKIEADLLSPIPEMRVAANRLKLWMKPYRKDIHKPTITTQGQLVGFLMHDREKESDIKACTSLLNLDRLLEIIANTTDEIYRLFSERSKDKNQQSVSSKELREAAYKDLQLLVAVMEVSYLMGKDEEEKERVAKLSKAVVGILKSFHTPLKSRNTKSRNKKEISEAIEQLIDTSNKPAPVKGKLPQTVSDDVEKSDMHKSSVSTTPQQATVETMLSQKNGESDKEESRKLNTEKRPIEFSGTNKNNKKGGDGMLPYISMN